MDDVNIFTCGYPFYIKTIFHSTTAIIDDLEGLDGDDAYSAWDEKLGGFLTLNNVTYWNFTIDGAIYNPQYGVASLAFESNYYTIAINSYFEIPFEIERGKPDKCVTGDDRIIVDLSRNILKSEINEETTINLKVECSTKTSTTNSVNIRIDIVDKYMKGIIGYYLKSNKFDSSCSSPYTLSSEGVKSEIIRLEDEVNKEYNENPSYWSGLTPNFASEYGVNWEGYLKIEENGSYIFNLSSISGSWLYIDYIELINYKGVHEWGCKTGKKYLNEGYHFIRVNYMKK